MKPHTSPALLASLILSLSCAGGPGHDPATTPTQNLMHGAFGAALSLRTAAIAGDLGWIAEGVDSLSEVRFTVDLPEETSPFLDDFRQSLGRLAGTRDVHGAALAVADLAGNCGACHRAAGVDLGDRFVIGGVSSREGLGAHMARQSWISRLLWDGLVGPSNRTWTEGARQLQVIPDLPDDAWEGDVWRELRRLGRSATAATTRTDRVRVLGQIWGACADCHRRADVGREHGR